MTHAVHTPPTRDPRHAPQWFTETKHRDHVAAIAAALLPHSVTKHEQFVLAIEWRDHRSDRPSPTRGRRSYDGTEETFYRRSRALNRRGPKEIAA